MFVNQICTCFSEQDHASTLHLLCCLDGRSQCCPDSFTSHGFGGCTNEEGGVGENVHKKSPWICQLINQGWIGSKRRLPAPSWLVLVYLFRVTRGQSRLTSNHQEQPQLRPSINKKCIMKVRGQRTGSGGRWRGGVRKRGGEVLSLFSKIGILSFSAELMRSRAEKAVCVPVFTSWQTWEGKSLTSVRPARVHPSCKHKVYFARSQIAGSQGEALQVTNAQRSITHS